MTSADVESLEYSYPIIVHRYSHLLRRSRKIPWRLRDRLVEPLDRDMLCIGFGEGRRIPAMGVPGPSPTDIDFKVGRVELKKVGKTNVVPAPTSWKRSSPAKP